ncbi:NAD-dependent epimerase/dehydratase family protein [Nitrosopumilus maritimus]|uniref:NAD-dependent epimerase/dehydratase n=1 Tax=Nitrosopumilus maritimus (strain SCM1) TaxID=436308 RepID=A9A1U3_NITMS|nr:NAD-dependent epimerase/dehydratase family protein [Nitrosopumilus maritimus]ABX12064.1 NAD-dependent epimerase/dehydratase [Nitrosopumilus maritimus SCM1]
MKILVTGGAGFIGRHLIKKINKKHELIIFENFSNSDEKNISYLLNDKTKLVKGDLTDFSLINSSLSNVDLVIHLAAKIDILQSIEHPDQTHKINVEGSLNLLRACVKNNVKNFIAASSAAVYGNPKQIPVTEFTIPNPVSPYGADKIALEFYLRAFCNAYGINGIALRFFNVYGLGQSNAYAGVITKFLNQIHQTKPLRIFGDGKNTRDFIHIDDLVMGIEQSISNISGKRGSVYNLASGKSVSVKELAKLMLEISDKKLEIKYESPRKGDLLYSSASIDLAKNDLSFVPKISLKDGISSLMKEINYQ